MAAAHCRDCAAVRHESQREWQQPASTQSTTLSPADTYVATQRHHLCSLPPEIRERIWRFVFSVPPTYRCQDCATCGSTPMQGLRTEIQHSPERAATRSVLSSLRTCKSLHSEAAHMFYSLNLLSLSSPAALYHFLANLSPRQRESIVALHVANVSPTHWTTTQIAPQAFALLSLCPRLEDLYMDFSVEHNADAQLGALLRSVFDNGEAFWTQTDFASAAEHEEHVFCQGFLALSQQRNVVRFGLRALHGENATARPRKMREQLGPYAYEDVMYRPVESVAVDTLRERMRQRRLRPATRLQRARNAVLREERATARSRTASEPVVAHGPIRPLNSKEARQEQSYLKQKSIIRTLFEHQIQRTAHPGSRLKLRALCRFPNGHSAPQQRPRRVWLRY